MSDITNPAAGASIFTQDNGQFRFGVLSSVGGGYEIGDIVNLVTEVDNTIDTFTNGLSDADPRIRPVDTGLTLQQNIDNVLSDINSIIQDTNILVNSLQRDGYFKGFGSLHAPIMPLVVSHKAISGSFVLDVNGSVVALASFLSDPLDPLIQSDVQTQVTAALASGPLDLGDLISSDTAIIIKGAGVAELSFGYSTSMWKTDDSQLFAGIRANYYKVELTRFAQLIDNADNQSLRDIFDDNKDNNLIDSTGFGVDLGLLWVSEHYRAGATFKNINKPSFDFNSLDTSGFTDPIILAELQKSDTYEMEPQLRLEGALFSANQNWVFGVSLDANAIDDPVGQEFQWATASAAYATDSFFLPGFRVGYRANLAGTELTYLTTGITLFDSFNLDIAYGLEDVKVEKNDLTSVDGTIPRSVIINLGLELTF